MAVTHPAPVRTALADFVVDQLDVNTPPGKIVLQTGAGAAVATLTLANPAFGAASNGIANANAIVADTNAVGGTIAKAELRQGAGTPIVLCSVTATGGGGDIQLNSVVISAGQQVSLTSLSYAAPA
jgi:hypothetical protein